MENNLPKQNRLPGCDKFTQPEEIKALSKYLKNIRKIQEEHTKLGKDNLEIPRDRFEGLPKIDKLSSKYLSIKGESLELKNLNKSSDRLIDDRVTNLVKSREDLKATSNIEKLGTDKKGISDIKQIEGLDNTNLLISNKKDISQLEKIKIRTDNTHKLVELDKTKENLSDTDNIKNLETNLLHIKSNEVKNLEDTRLDILDKKVNKELPEDKLDIDSSNIKSSKLDNRYLSIEDPREIKGLSTEYLSITGNNNFEKLNKDKELLDVDKKEELSSIKLDIENNRENKDLSKEVVLIEDERKTKLSKSIIGIENDKEVNLEKESININNINELSKLNESIPLKIKNEGSTRLGESVIPLKDNNKINNLSENISELPVLNKNVKLNDSVQKLRGENKSLVELDSYIENIDIDKDITLDNDLIKLHKIKNAKLDSSKEGLIISNKDIKLNNSEPIEIYDNRKIELDENKEIIKNDKVNQLSNIIESLNLSEDDLNTELSIKKLDIQKLNKDLKELPLEKQDLLDQRNIRLHDNIKDNAQLDITTIDDLNFESDRLNLDNTRENNLEDKVIDLEDTRENNLEDKVIDLEDTRENSLEDKVIDLDDLRENSLEDKVIDLDDSRENSLEDKVIDLDDSRENSLENKVIDLEDTRENNLEDKVIDLDDSRENSLEDKIIDLEDPRENSLEDKIIDLEDSRENNLEDKVIGLDDPRENSLEDKVIDLDDLRENSLEDKVIDLDDPRENSLEDKVIDLDDSRENSLEDKVIDLDDSRENSLENKVIDLEDPRENNLEDKVIDLDKSESPEGQSDYSYDKDQELYDNVSIGLGDSENNETFNPDKDSLYDSVIIAPEAQASKSQVKDYSYTKDLSDDDLYKEVLRIIDEAKGENGDWEKKIQSLISAYLSSEAISLERAKEFESKLEETGKILDITSKQDLPQQDSISDVKLHNKETLKETEYKLPGFNLGMINLSSFLRFGAEKAVPNKIHGKLRTFLLNEALGLLILGREKLEKLTKSNRDRLPGNDAGILGDLVSGGLKGAATNLASGLKGALLGYNRPDLTNPINRPKSNLKGEVEETEGWKPANNRIEKDPPSKQKKKLGQVLKNVAKSALGINGKDKRDYLFKDHYLLGGGIKTTVSELCNADVSSVTSVDKFYDILKKSPYITTPSKFSTSSIGEYGTMTLDSNSYWEIILTPYVGNENGNFSFLPAIHEINTSNAIYHGVKTCYNVWIPFNSFDLQKSKLSTKSVGLYDGEIIYPTSIEFVNEFRVSIVDDQYKSWRNYFEKCMEVSVYSSEPHDLGYYVDLSSDKNELTAIDKSNQVIAMYKNLAFQCIVYMMTPQLSTIRKFNLLLVLKDFTEEYSGDIDSGGTDLSVNFSIVGENPSNSKRSLPKIPFYKVPKESNPCTSVLGNKSLGGMNAIK